MDGKSFKIFSHLQKSLLKAPSTWDQVLIQNKLTTITTTKKTTHVGEFGGNKVQRIKLHLFCVGDRGDGSRESKALVLMSEIATSEGELAGCSTV